MCHINIQKISFIATHLIVHLQQGISNTITREICGTRSSHVTSPPGIISFYQFTFTLPIQPVTLQTSSTDGLGLNTTWVQQRATFHVTAHRFQILSCAGDPGQFQLKLCWWRPGCWLCCKLLDTGNHTVPVSRSALHQLTPSVPDISRNPLIQMPNPNPGVEQRIDEVIVLAMKSLLLICA